MRKKTSISIDEELELRIRAAAKQQRRSVSQVIELSLEFGLPEVEERCAVRFSMAAPSADVESAEAPEEELFMAAEPVAQREDAR